MKLQIKKLNSRATLPTYGTSGAAGADLYALLDAPVTIAPHETLLIHTGLAIAVPEGYAGLIYPRSGMASKRGLAPANKVGVVDSDYRGEVMVALHNHGDVAQTITDGERVAQLVITPVLQVAFDEVEELDNTTRGAGGFGSTGMGATIEAPAPTEAPVEVEEAPEETTEEPTPNEEATEIMVEEVTEEVAPETADEESSLTPEALTERALAYFHGMGVPFNRKEAVRLLRLAAERGETLARARLAYLSCIGDEVAGIRQDVEKGSAILAEVFPVLKMMAKDNLEAMLLLGNMMADGYGTHRNPRRGFEYYYTAAEKGYAPAANAMGQCYNAGIGVSADVVRSVACFHMAAEAGFAPGQFNYGVSCFNGRGIRQDKVEAAKWYTLAAEQGYAPAEFVLGKHYFQIMNGVENDREKGLEWLTRSAEQGYMKAIIYLADIYHHAGTKEGDRRAAGWYSVAAKRGEAYALYQLSCYAAVGRGGIKRDPAASETLLRRAASLGDREAIRKWQTLYGEENN